eukprot:GEMP01068194.1.p1 GENE.GEMP01068194.1~~GEMP01068194.1.p1  ORF type:complete len:192 (-),score=30.26 GEMP01068194.1:604-1179(-)
MFIRDIKSSGPRETILYVQNRKYGAEFIPQTLVRGEHSPSYRRRILRAKQREMSAGPSRVCKVEFRCPVIYPKDKSSSRDDLFNHGAMTDIIFLRDASRPKSRPRTNLRHPTASEQEGFPRRSSSAADLTRTCSNRPSVARPQATQRRFPSSQTPDPPALRRQSRWMVWHPTPGFASGTRDRMRFVVGLPP